MYINWNVYTVDVRRLSEHRNCSEPIQKLQLLDTYI